jgi:hypothetical protein
MMRRKVRAERLTWALVVVAYALTCFLAWHFPNGIQ